MKEKKRLEGVDVAMITCSILFIAALIIAILTL